MSKAAKRVIVVGLALLVGPGLWQLYAKTPKPLAHPAGQASRNSDFNAPLLAALDAQPGREPADARNQAARADEPAGNRPAPAGVKALAKHIPPVPAAARAAQVQPARRTASQAPIVRSMIVTAYCPCAKCCGGHACGITASGRSVRANGGRFVAADAAVPFDTRVSIPGYNHGRPVPVLDRGGRIVGNRLDVFFPDHKTAQQWGVRRVNVVIYE